MSNNRKSKQLSEGPLSAIGRAAAKAARIGKTRPARIMPELNKEIDQRITVIKSVKQPKDLDDIQTMLEQSAGVLKVIDKMPEDTVIDALKHINVSINDVRKLASDLTKLQKQLDSVETVNQKFLKDALQTAKQIKAGTDAAGKAAQTEKTAAVIRNAVTIAAIGGLAGLVAAAALDHRSQRRNQTNEAEQLDEIGGLVKLGKFLPRVGKAAKKLPPARDDFKDMKASAKSAAAREKLGIGAEEDHPLLRRQRVYKTDNSDTKPPQRPNYSVDPDAEVDTKSIKRPDEYVEKDAWRYNRDEMRPYTSSELAKQNINPITGKKFTSQEVWLAGALRTAIGAGWTTAAVTASWEGSYWAVSIFIMSNDHRRYWHEESPLWDVTPWRSGEAAQGRLEQMQDINKDIRDAIQAKMKTLSPKARESIRDLIDGAAYKLFKLEPKEDKESGQIE